ncbi:Dyp-type peroxidase [Dactylosporangium sp. CA-139066]|uniref:Dyp-type peroxidase n=1 Tax=Dactylosporangium sp. CA-139066 TaxID=3239930 RepID=UPI003D8AAB43
MNTTAARLELRDIQRGVLSPRPTPYAATYLLFRIDDPADGRQLMRRAAGVVTSAADEASALGDTSVSVAVTYHGLRTLGLPQRSLDTFAWEFRQGMAARHAALGDTADSAPERWEPPLGSPDVHVAVTVVAPDRGLLDAAIDRARPAYATLPGVTAIWRQECHALTSETEPFGYRDGVSHPAVKGSGIPGSNPLEPPLEPGEFVLGYPDELGGTQRIQPEILGRNGSYVAFRKLHQRVAAFRRYLAEHATTPGDEAMLAAKLMGRWRSGAPLALSPHRDDPALGADPHRRNAFGYADDPTGYVTPGGSHIRRTNPRDAAVAGEPRLHRMIRRGTVYGPPLPDGVLDDDGADRGIMFAFVGAHLGRQFEFVQSEWINDGVFFGAGGARDPIAGRHSPEHAGYTIPRRPLRRRLEGLPQFVVTRGGEYCFMPGLRALRWLGDQAA